MSTGNEFLAQHPQIGLFALAIAFITPFISVLLPVIQLLVAVAGLLIGILTIEAKWNERKIKRKQLKDKK